MALGVNIISGFDGKGIQKAIREFQKLETTGEKAQFALQKAALPAAAALAGLAAAAGLSVKKAIEDQQEQVKLAQSIEQVTGASQEAIKKNEEYLASLQRTTIFSDSEMRPALANLVQASGDLARSQEDLRLAMDISTATGVPLTQVTDALGRAYNGNYKALRALSPALGDNIKEGQSLDQVFQELSKTFSGATAAASETAGGKMIILRNQIGELSESFGTALLPVVESLVPVFSSLANFAENNRTAFLILAGVVAAFSTAILAANAAVKIHTTYQNLMKIEVLKSSAAFQGLIGATKGMISAFAGIAILEGVTSLINNVTGATKNQKKAFEDTAIAVNNFSKGAGSAEDAWKEFSGAVQNEVGRLRGPIESIKDNLSLKTFGREFEIGAEGLFGNIKADIEDVDAVFQKFLDTNVDTAAGIVEAMKAQLLATEPNTRAYSDLSAMIARYEAMVIRARAATGALGGAMDTTTEKAFVMSGALARLTNLQIRENKARQDGSNWLEEWNDKVKSSISAGSGAAKQVETAKEKMMNYISALRGVADAQRSLTDSSKGVISAKKRLSEATSSVTRAQANFDLITRGYPRSSREAQNAMRATADATRALRDATRNQTDALAEVKKAEQELAALRNRQVDPRSVADAERQLERSRYGLEEAGFRVAEIEKELAALRADPDADPVELRRKEIEFAEAKLALADANDSVADAETKLADVRNVSPKADELAEAEKNLSDAKIRVEDATLAVADATLRQAVAQAMETEVLEGAKEGSEAYESALEDLTSAKERQADAIEAVEDALYREAQAIEAVREAEEKLAEQRAKTPANIIAKAEQRFEALPTQNVPMNSGSSGGSMTNNLTVNAGMGTNPTEVAQIIVDHLDEWTRWNGALSNYLQVV